MAVYINGKKKNILTGKGEYTIMKAKHSTKLFLKVLEDATIEMEECPSKEFRRGVKATVKAAKEWFKTNQVKEIDIKFDDE